MSKYHTIHNLQELIGLKSLKGQELSSKLLI
jgi:hypothetical protein